MMMMMNGMEKIGAETTPAFLFLLLFIFLFLFLDEFNDPLGFKPR